MQQILEGLSKQWTDILNLFPVIVHDKMIPSLENANSLLNTFFGKLKFSELGSLNIQQEIERLSQKTGPEGFFYALRETIGAGILESLKRAGLGNLDTLVTEAFAAIPEGTKFLDARNKLPGLKLKGKPEDVQASFEALERFVGITSQLGQISSQGVTPFLTARDLALVEEKIGDVLKAQRGAKEFTVAVEGLEEDLKPVLDFLQRSLQETGQIFGRGLVAALDAATQSDAIRLFNQSIGEGTKELLFKGITEAFIASAQFNDLLAPIQQTIRQFTTGSDRNRRHAGH